MNSLTITHNKPIKQQQTQAQKAELQNSIDIKHKKRATVAQSVKLTAGSKC